LIFYEFYRVGAYERRTIEEGAPVSGEIMFCEVLR
jgi:hypothetical protein